MQSWLSQCTLAELVRKGFIDAHKLWHTKGNSARKLFFNAQGKEISFSWNTWTPRLPLTGLSEDQLRKLRRNARLLVYLCRWVWTHRALEDERSHPNDAPSGRSKDRTVAKWVRYQRKEDQIGKIDKKLEQLRALALDAFLAGDVRESLGSVQPQDRDVLPVSRESLLCFALSQCLEANGSLRTVLRSKALSNVEFCRVLHGLAVMSHTAFDLHDGSDDAVHRLILLVSAYGHRDLGIPARLDLRAHLLHAARGEPALHALKRFYRDHFFHALQVTFLGHALLDTRIQENPDRRLWHAVADRLCLRGKDEDRRKQVLRLWHMAALLHDLGYAMDVFNASKRHLGFFSHSKALRELGENLSTALASLSRSEELTRLGLEPEDGLGENHGVVGAMHLQSLLDRIGKDDPRLKPADYLPAVRAVALHHWRPANHKVSFSRDPLAFLLILCDQVQEWRRPRLNYPTSANWMLAALDKGSHGSSGLDSALRSMSASLIKSSGPSVCLSFPRYGSAAGVGELTLALEYNSEISRDSQVFNLWLDATGNFQRLDVEGLPLRIQVSFRTPAYGSPNSNDACSQLSRLRDAAHETHMTFLDKWFPATPSSGSWLTNGAVSHHYDETFHTEELRLDLTELSRRPLITRDLDAFWERLKEWKRFGDDREFPGDYVSVRPE